MRVGLLETDEALALQTNFIRCVDDRLRLNLPGLRYLSSWETLLSVGEGLKGFRAKLVFLGSGDFHHLSLLFIRREARRRSFSVLVLDRHLDFFPCAAGFVSCGSWLREVTELPAVRRVLVLGVAEPLPTPPPRIVALSPQAWWYWFSRVPHRLLSFLGSSECYISIDKDVFAETATDWGRGRVPVGRVFSFLGWLLRRVRVVGVDVCGEFIPRNLWPTVEERQALAASEKINLLLCGFFRRWGRWLEAEGGLGRKPHRVRIQGRGGHLSGALGRAG